MFILKSPRGRSGNILFQNVGLSVLSEFYNLKPFGYISLDYFNTIGLKVNFNGREINDLISIDDLDLPNFLIDNSTLNSGVLFDGGFQDRTFVTKFRSQIKNCFDLKYQDMGEFDLFIHVRLDDVAEHNPGLDFYRKAIKTLNFKKGYISSDTPNHPIVNSLIEEYGLKFYDSKNPLEIINFGKNFRNIIISKGTFSWWIANLSKADNIICPIGDPSWYGDIFVYEDWTYIPIK